ncbi:sulfatase-like hydrolase/transferase [Pararhodobacter zhoushanensis]|uniref:sulfatase-like hydrolase/transferase n=1 Tax=Pararhodobacter zhoushanensis TaxID=2479545 RepID=UPI001C709BA4|nr:sulfatase-like hydrolase/transferase [Pararhodobacter zhoushanensis]
MARNILWIMCDQLRFDYLGCAGHPSLKTPHIDALAARGVRFTNAYVQSTICGPSRMSAYTGRYVRSHGSTYNGVPLRVGEPMLGDHLREAGMDCVLLGKTHMTPDRDGMARLGIEADSLIGVRSAECGFDPFDRHDGLHPSKHPGGGGEAYQAYLRAKGYDGDNLWEEWTNSAEGPAGERLNGWLWAHSDKPARVAEADSETAYLTDRAMAFIDGAIAKGKPWCAHLSYIKPHWPYLAPAPYHNLYGAEDLLDPVRSESELADPHPLYAAFTQERHALTLCRDGGRERVIPAYMGLIQQIDDHLGRLFAFLEDRGIADQTVIAFTSDHGDYLGDHWLGEKYLFHDASVKVPLILYDPAPEADATRGTTSDALVEMIDLAPTFLELAGAAPKPHVLEGHSLLPLLRDPTAGLARTHVFSEYDYASDQVRVKLGTSVQDSRLTMVFDGRWKMIDCRGLPPMLFDLETDPDELCDLGRAPGYDLIRARLFDAIRRWYHDGRNRISCADTDFTQADELLRIGADPVLKQGVVIGYWDEAELATAQALIAQAEG